MRESGRVGERESVCVFVSELVNKESERWCVCV